MTSKYNAEAFDYDTISEAAELIKKGQLVAFPTETVYGLGANAFDSNAVARIFEAKGRPTFDPLIVHIADVDSLWLVAKEANEKARKCMEKFWPGPFTAILPKKETISDLVTSGLDTVGVRVPDHRTAQKLLLEAGTPVAAPSANLFSHTSPTEAWVVREMLGDRIEGIVDDGPCQVGVESTIVSFCEEPPVLYRAGGIPVEEIEALIGPIRIAGATGEEKKAPGRTLRHYAPRTPMYLYKKREDLPENARVGLLKMAVTEEESGSFDEVKDLSESGNLREAAMNLYSSMRALDGKELDYIIAEQVLNEDLGRAINDRLRRAAEDGFLRIDE